jgi:hypothetical protein
MASGKFKVVEISGLATENFRQKLLQIHGSDNSSQQGFGNMGENSCIACVIARLSQPRN